MLLVHHRIAGLVTVVTLLQHRLLFCSGIPIAGILFLVGR
jgi:hypothetical protein